MTAACKLFAAIAVAEETVVADALKAIRQEMQEKTSNELLGRQRHGLMSIVVPVILPVKTNLIVVDVNQAIVGKGNAMGIAADVVEHLSRPAERRFGVDDPWDFLQRGEIGAELGRIFEVFQ